MKRDNWIVSKSSTGPGNDTKCLYCHVVIGGVHALDCVIRKRTVKVRAICEYVITVPEHWSVDDIDFHRNESSWCSHNGVSEMEKLSENGIDCCSFIRWEFVKEADEADEDQFEIRVTEAES